MNVEEAKEYLKANFRNGVACPCCGQFVKKYSRSITGAMAVGLIHIYKKDTFSFIHVENYLKDIPNLPASIRGDISKLRFWGLIQKESGIRADGSSRNGFYKITHKGAEFVEGRFKVHKHIFLYNNKFLGEDLNSPLITITQCLGKKFDYQELMRGH